MSGTCGYRSKGCSCDSLKSICIDFLVSTCVNQSKILGDMSYLPVNIKNRILKKFTFRQETYDTYSENVLKMLVGPHVNRIHFTGANNNVLKILEECSNLQNIFLCNLNENVTSAALTDLFKITKHLSCLRISHCKVFDNNALRIVAENCPNIFQIDAKSCQNISDEGLKALANLENLKYLCISHTTVSDFGITCLAKGKSRQKLEELILDYCINITDNGIKIIACNCPNLKILTFQYSGASDKDGTLLTLISNYCQKMKQINWSFPF